MSKREKKLTAEELEKRRAAERARGKKRRMAVKVSDAAIEKRREYDRAYRERNLEKVRAAQAERARKKRAAKKDEINAQRRAKTAEVAAIPKAVRRHAGWRWRKWQFIDTGFEQRAAEDWYEQWFASLDEPELSPW